MSILSPSGLEQADYTLPGWNFIHAKNTQLLNDALLKLEALQDAHLGAKQDGAVMVWDNATSKYVAKRRA